MKKPYNWLSNHKVVKKQDLTCEKKYYITTSILCIDEIKLQENFPDAQFMIENYQFPHFERYRSKKGCGKMVFIRKELLAKKFKT